MSGFLTGRTSLTTVQVSDLATGTDGELITWDSSADPAAVGVGSSTHVLTSNGAGAAPTFQAAAGGDVEFVSTAALTTATSVEVNNFAAGYDYVVVFESFGLTTDNQQLWCRFSDDAGSSFESGAADYEWGMQLDGASYTDASDDEIKITSGVS